MSAAEFVQGLAPATELFWVLQLTAFHDAQELAQRSHRILASSKSHDGEDFERELKRVVLRAFEQRGEGFCAGSSNRFFRSSCLRLGQTFQHLDARCVNHGVNLPVQ